MLKHTHIHHTQSASCKSWALMTETEWPLLYWLSRNDPRSEGINRNRNRYCHKKYFVSTWLMTHQNHHPCIEFNILSIQNYWHKQQTHLTIVCRLNENILFRIMFLNAKLMLYFGRKMLIRTTGWQKNILKIDSESDTYGENAQFINE